MTLSLAAISEAVRGRLRPLALRLAGLTGWRRWGVAFLLGALATLALPPACLVPALLVAMPGLLWLLDGAGGSRSALAIGWWFGFGFFFCGLYWISFAMLTDIARFWWLMPFAMAGLPAALALFTALAVLALYRLHLGGLARCFAFAALWAAAEWLRGHILTGFPWNLLGYVWVDCPPVLQAAAVVGVYGLSLVTIVVASLPAALADRDEPAPRALAALVAGLVLLAGIAAAGAVRLSAADSATVPGVRLRLVQADIAQSQKWQPEQRDAILQRYLGLSAGPPSGGGAWPTVVIWPETAVPFFLDQDRPHRLKIADNAPGGALTVTGVPRAAPLGADRWRFWNSLVAIDGKGAVVGLYDKAHLVPFGEYIPGHDWLLAWLPFASIAGGMAGFAAGPGPATLDLPGLPPVSPLICYEAIFPGAVVDPARRPRWLLNLTNDAWYGHTAGPHQHFAMTRVRAVEEGLPLVRAANTGISGVVDAYGRVTARLGLGATGVVDADLPVATPVATPYGRSGDWPFGVMLFGCVIVTIFARHRGAAHPSSA
ncbi:MAG: apolipoprotein N-acyltransferase [Azospirillum sp.]|nr:apolipoprotein N-acyltransferase [Azospirillum sp.]